jgi:hypothetical protein
MVKLSSTGTVCFRSPRSKLLSVLILSEAGHVAWDLTLDAKLCLRPCGKGLANGFFDGFGVSHRGVNSGQENVAEHRG